jgi:hypothetical protein
MSLLICGFFGPVVWIMGSRDLQEMKEGTLKPSGRAMTQAGMYLGILGTAAGVAQVLWLLSQFGLVNISFESLSAPALLMQLPS